MADPAFDAASNPTNGFTADTSWSHDPVAVIRGVAVCIAQDGSAADEVAGVTYDGLALTRVGMASIAATSTGASWLYFRGTGLPGDAAARTVAIDVTGTAPKAAWAITFTADGDLEVVEFDVLEATVDDPAITLPTLAGFVGMLAAALWSGRSAVGNIAAVAPAVKVANPHDFTANTGHAFYEAASGANADIATTATGSDDTAMIAAAIAQVAGGTQFTITPAGAVTPTGALTKAAAKVVGGAWTPSGSITKAVAKALAAAIAPAGALALAAARALAVAGSLSSSGTVTNATGKALAGELVPAAAVVKAVSKTSSGEVTPEGDPTKAVAKPLAGEITPAGDVSMLRFIALIVGGAIAPAGSLRRDVAQALAGTLSSSGTVRKDTAKNLSGSTTPEGALATLRFFALQLAGAIAPDGVITKAIEKRLAGEVTPTGSIRKAISKFLSAVLATAGSLITAATGAQAKACVTVDVRTPADVDVDASTPAHVELEAVECD